MTGDRSDRDAAPTRGRASTRSTEAPRPVVLVLGGGFAGIGAARALKKADVDVVLVDAHDYHTFQPLLYQVATDLLETVRGRPPAARPLPRAAERHRPRGDGPRRSISSSGRCSSTDMDPLSYDYLVLALGARVEFFGVEGAADHAFPMYTLADAVRLKEHVLREVGGGRQGPGADRRRRAQRRRRRRRPHRHRERGRAGGALPQRTSRRTTRRSPRRRRASSWSRPARRCSRCSSRGSATYAQAGAGGRGAWRCSSARRWPRSSRRGSRSSPARCSRRTRSSGAPVLHASPLADSLGLELERGDRSPSVPI